MNEVWMKDVHVCWSTAYFLFTPVAKMHQELELSAFDCMFTGSELTMQETTL